MPYATGSLFCRFFKKTGFFPYATKKQPGIFTSLIEKRACAGGTAIMTGGNCSVVPLLYSSFPYALADGKSYLGEGEGYLSFFSMIMAATLSPSMAALTMPPAYPAPSPQG
jgi:hypothetical protein